MDIKLFDSELKVMEVIWNEGNVSAKRIAEVLKDEVGWSKTTTYTVIKKCINKGAIERTEPNFICNALISKEEVQEADTEELINKMYDGKKDQLIACLLDNKKLTTEEIAKLKELVNNLK